LKRNNPEFGFLSLTLYA